MTNDRQTERGRKRPSRRTIPRLVLMAMVLAALLAACTDLEGQDDGLRIVSFQSAPLDSESGTFRLSWQVEGLGDGTLVLRPAPDGSGSRDVAQLTVAGVGGVDVEPGMDTIYTLTARNGTREVARTVAVRISDEGPRILAFEAEPSSSGFLLSWSVEDLDDGSLTLEPGPDGKSSIDVTNRTSGGEGSIEVDPPSTTTYRLLAENDEGSAQALVEVDGTATGEGPEILEFGGSSDAELVNPGVALEDREVESILSWTVQDADEVYLFGPDLPADGEDVTEMSSFDVASFAGAEYTLEAANDQGDAERTYHIASREVPAASFLIAGQSNAQGVNLVGEDATDYISADAGVRMLGNDYVWKGAYEPLDDCTGQVDEVSEDPEGEDCPDGGRSGVSLGVSLGNRVSDVTGGEVFLIPAAKGGSSASDWQPGSDWHDRSTLFGSANYRASLAGSERGAPLRYEHGGVRYGAVVWYQGESDTTSVSKTDDFVDSTDTVLGAFQGDLDAPVFLVQLSGRFEGGRNELYQRVREYQRLMASGARTVGGGSSGLSESDRFLVVTHDLPLVEEYTSGGAREDKHLTAAAQVELGRRVSLAFREHLLGESVDGSGPRLVGVEVVGSTVYVEADRAITAPGSSGAGAYSGYFSVFDGTSDIGIVSIGLADSSTVEITLAEEPSSASNVRVAYMPPAGSQFSVKRDVIRSADCEDPMPGMSGTVCLPMPAFGMTPEDSQLRSLRFQAADDE